MVEKSGAWFSYDGQRIGQGRENAKQFLQGESRRSRPRSRRPIRQNAGLVAGAMMDAKGGGARRRRPKRNSMATAEGGFPGRRAWSRGDLLSAGGSSENARPPPVARFPFRGPRLQTGLRRQRLAGSGNIAQHSAIAWCFHPPEIPVMIGD